MQKLVSGNQLFTYHHTYKDEFWNASAMVPSRVGGSRGVFQMPAGPLGLPFAAEGQHEGEEFRKPCSSFLNQSVANSAGVCTE